MNAIRKKSQSARGARAGAGAMILLGTLFAWMAPTFGQDTAAQAAQDTTAQDKSKIEGGETVYNTHCAICHGDDLVNTGQTFDLRRLTANERPRFENSVRNGKNQMPPWKDVLNDEQIDQLWHYIRANAYQK